MRALPSTSPLTAMYDGWTRPSYEVRVRGPGVGAGPWPWPGINFLWGSANIPTPISFDKSLILHIRNDLFGADVTFGSLVGILTTGTKTQIGILQPGDCISIPVQGISAVYATCAAGLESVVGCIIKDSA
jgi:hypothetical protein